VHRPQRLRADDVDRGVQVVEAHDDEERRHDAREQAAVAAGRALLLLDERLGGLEPFGQRDIERRGVVDRFWTGGQGSSRSSPAVGI
jgi:hypothetical protein